MGEGWLQCRKKGKEGMEVRVMGGWKGEGNTYTHVSLIPVLTHAPSRANPPTHVLRASYAVFTSLVRQILYRSLQCRASRLLKTNLS